MVLPQSQCSVVEVSPCFAVHLKIFGNVIFWAVISTISVYYIYEYLCSMRTERSELLKNNSRLSIYKTNRGNILFDKFSLNLPLIGSLNCYSD